ncbi:SPOR domain-containing protein [Humidesulfovibrio sp.]
MNGPRLFSRTHVLALAALMLLPACSPRKPIPSDPPEVRTEAQVRGAARKSVPPAAAPAPVAQAMATPEVEVAHVVASEAKPVVAAQVDTTKADAAKVEAQKDEAMAAAPVSEAAKEAPAKAEAVKTEAPKTAAVVETMKAEAEAAAQPAQAVAKPEPSEAAKAEQAADQAAAAKKAAEQAAHTAPRTPAVQIASFTTEKNAEGALSWLKEKGYSEARVVRVEQGQTVYHRVQAGPFQDLDAARKALEELKSDWPQAFIPAD